MLENRYILEDPSQIRTPELLFYSDLIEDNLQKAIGIAGGPGRLWPHVKSHKMEEMVRLSQARGITRFKCATLAELAMVIRCRVDDALLAYPLTGPDIPDFLELAKGAERTRVWALGDDYETLLLLSEAAVQAGLRIPFMLDVNLGMNRTGVLLEDAGPLYRSLYPLAGLDLGGLHCYDGHVRDRDREIRLARVSRTNDEIRQLKEGLEAEGMDCGTVIAGGSPTFACHAETSDFYLSPGTLFLHDYGYWRDFPDLPFLPAACLLTRVVSHPLLGIFTLDLGSKAIASDPEGVRGLVLGLEGRAEPLFQSEEHWVFRMTAGEEAKRPAIGSVQYVIPTHICPTTALYPAVLAVREGRITGSWPVTARNRALSFDLEEVGCK